MLLTCASFWTNRYHTFHLSPCSLTCCPEQGRGVWAPLHLYSFFYFCVYFFPVKTASWQVLLRQVSQNWQEHNTGVYLLTESQQSNGLWTSGHFWDFWKFQYHSFPLLMGLGGPRCVPRVTDALSPLHCTHRKFNSEEVSQHSKRETTES